MALNINSLKQALIDMTDELKTIEDSEEGRNRWAELLSQAIDTYIKSGDVTEQVFTVSTTGTATAQTGTATQVSKGKIS